MQFYVYSHAKADTGEVFYIGKGRVATRGRTERSHETASRSTFWRRVVAKHGFTVKIERRFETDAEAQDHEKKLIAYHGRRNTGGGSLVNLTDGGDGSAGLVAGPELRRKRSENAKKKRSAAWVASIRAARKDNCGVVKKGGKLSAKWRQAIAAGQCGPNNYMRGRTGAAHPNRREVVNTKTGARYPTIQAAADALGLKMKSLYNKLSGHRPNDTNLRFAA